MPKQLEAGTVKPGVHLGARYPWGEWIKAGEFEFTRKTEANPSGDYSCTTGGFIAAMKKACKKLSYTSVVQDKTPEGFKVIFRAKSA